MIEPSHLLSVIVPVSNMEGRLGYLEDWLKKSKGLDLQIILIHDKSGDSTGAELTKILTENGLEDVILIEGFFGSPGSARNVGIDASSGMWIAFWDSDDVPNAAVISGYLDHTVDCKSQVVVGSFQTVDLSNGEVKSQILSNPKSAETILAIGMNPGLWRFVIRHTLIDDSRFPATKMAEDQAFLVNILAKTEFYETTQQIFYTYHKGVLNQLTSRKDAIEDLPKSLESLSTARYILKDLSVVRLIMAYRQLVTGLKLCSWRKKVKTVKAFVIFSLKTRFTLRESFAIIKIFAEVPPRKLRLGK